MKKQLIIAHKQPNALGDGALMTALVRDVHRAYPNQFEISAVVNFKHVLKHNPLIVSSFSSRNGPPIRAEVGWGRAMRQHGMTNPNDPRTKRHILAWYHHCFEEITGLKVPVTEPKPDLYLTDEEKIPIVEGRYWVIVAGGKWDTTVKLWRSKYAQNVVDTLAERGIRCVQIGGVGEYHTHPELKNVTNLLGRTEEARQFWNLIYHSDGVVCGVTGPMHVAAAFDKPCVVYGGGREDPWFEAYVDDYAAFGPHASRVKVPHRYLSAVGKLPCCERFGCWASAVVPVLHRKKSKRKPKMCAQPVFHENESPIAACQDLIEPSHVIDAVWSYYADGTLPLPDGKMPILREERLIVLPPVPAAQQKQSGNGSKPQRKDRMMPNTPSIPVLTTPADIPVMRHPIIGGKITIFVLCYGNYPELAKRCIGSILQTVPRQYLDLRVGANMPSDETIEFLSTVPATHRYVHEQNDYKYPVMREMLYDSKNPIETKYFLWFDDDTWIVNPQWLEDLATRIVTNHPNGVRMYGTKMFHNVNMYRKNGHNPKVWFETADWYRGKHLKKRPGGPDDVDGSIIEFALGACWAMETAAMRFANVPDRRLAHNGGDITIGEQMHQANYRIADWNRKNSFVAWPSRAEGGRRGADQRFPWANP